MYDPYRDLKFLTASTTMLRCRKGSMSTVAATAAVSALFSGALGSIVGALLTRNAALKVSQQERMNELRMRTLGKLDDIEASTEDLNQLIIYRDFKNPKDTLSIWWIESEATAEASRILEKKVQSCLSLTFDPPVNDQIKDIYRVFKACDPEKGVDVILSRGRKTTIHAYSHQEFFEARANYVLDKIPEIRQTLIELISTGSTSKTISTLLT